MKYRIVKIIGTFLMFNSIIHGTSGQEYVSDSDIFYSHKLKAGMEFTWEIVKFDFEFNFTEDGSPLLNQATTSTVSETSTVTDVTSTITIVETTTEVGGPNEDSLPPKIAPGTKYSIRLLKDLGDLSQEEYWAEYGALSGQYFEASFSDPSLNENEDLFSLDGFIVPTDIRFDNGTVLNFFEYQVMTSQRNQEEFSSGFGEDEIYIEDGVAFQYLNITDDEQTLIFDTRIDVETGIFLYAALFQDSSNFKVDILIKLEHTEGIDINTVIGNNDPTLSVPLSAIFVYTLILVPIIVNRIRKN